MRPRCVFRAVLYLSIYVSHLGSKAARSAGGRAAVCGGRTGGGAESRFWGVFIIAVQRAFVLGLGARHRGIVELSEGG